MRRKGGDDMNEVINNIYKRKSVRKFLSEQIPKDIVETIVKAGIEAPSGHNTQPVRFTIIRDSKLIDEMSEVAKSYMKDSHIDWISKYGNNEKYHVLHHAPTVVIISASEKAYSPVEDCSAAIENMLLAATSLNIGSLWVELIKHYFIDPISIDKLKIKEGFKPLYAVCLGYENLERVFNKPSRKEDVYEWIES